MNSKYVLMLVHVDKNFVDVAGNEFPLEGFVESNEFTNDKDLRYGLLGVPWGKTFEFIYDRIEDGEWFVLKTQIDDNFITIDSYHNQVKFKNGFILCHGNIKQCAEFIIKNKNDVKQGYLIEASFIKEKEIAGSEEWINIYNF